MDCNRDVGVLETRSFLDKQWLMRAALYLRTSTLDQTTDNQERELRAVAERLGHEVVEVYADNGISGAKGREKRPAFNRLCRDMTRRRCDIIMAWSVDRLGRSLQDLVAFLSNSRQSYRALFASAGARYVDAMGRAMFQMMGVFAEFERAMIAERVRSGMAHAKVQGTKSGKAIGRPRLDPRTELDPSCLCAWRRRDAGRCQEVWRCHRNHAPLLVRAWLTVRNPCPCFVRSADSRRYLPESRFQSMIFSYGCTRYSWEGR